MSTGKDLALLQWISVILRFIILPHYRHPSPGKAKLGSAHVTQDSVPRCCKMEQQSNPLPQYVIIHSSLANGFMTEDQQKGLGPLVAAQA